MNGFAVILSCILLMMLPGAGLAKEDEALTIAADSAAVSQTADELSEASEPYDVKTLIATAQFTSKPRIYTYNYLLSDNVCKMAEYCLTQDESECILITLTLPDELSAAISDFSDDDMSSLLRMAMDALESVGLLLDVGEEKTLYDMPCREFAAYSDTTEYAGWAVMNDKQVQFVLATVDDIGYDFLNTVKARRDIVFVKDNDNVIYDNVTLNFPYSVKIDGASALSTNDLTCERAGLIQLSDYMMLNSPSDSDGMSDLLREYVPENAQDVSTQTLGNRITMTYAYDDEGLNEPIQGRLILLDDCILRMEATFDNAGDAFMDGVYITAD